MNYSEIKEKVCNLTQKIYFSLFLKAANDTVTNFTLTPSFTNLNNLSPSRMQQILNILESNNDVSSCLSNCSNQGVCKLSNQTYICECSPSFKGKSCQTDERPCSQSNKCLNNGTCINSFDLTSSKCQCPQNSVFYGQYCENVKNLCENETCSLHGYCHQQQSENKCKCFKGFNGDKCELESNEVKAVKSVQWTTTIICILCIILFCILVLGNDALNYLNISDKSINIDEWRREKLHGEKTSKPKNVKKKTKQNGLNSKNKTNLKKKQMKN